MRDDVVQVVRSKYRLRQRWHVRFVVNGEPILWSEQYARHDHAHKTGLHAARAFGARFECDHGDAEETP